MQKSRRILHQPFFPTTSSPPSQPPSPSPPFPKYPFSSNPTKPFFPDYPTPPSPPSPPPPSTSATPSIPTFPANISSLIYPNSQNAPVHAPPHRLLPAILFSLLGLSLLILASAFFFHRRRRQSNHHDHSFPPDPTRSNVHKLATSAPTNSTSAHPAAVNSSDFLYLGTLVNSRSTVGQHRQPSRQPHAIPSPKLGSPELHPLPPLSRQVRHNHGNATGGNSDEDDEFYSPRADSSSAAEKFETVKCRSRRSSDTSSPSYPTSSGSGSGSPASSPDRSSPVLDSSPANSGSKISRSGPPLPPGPPPPPLPAVGGNVASRIPYPPPPPPPPPPSFGTWENQIRNPPILVSPTKSPETDTAHNLEALETTPRPKLKPLHWDKVRASSDRAMVWDQLKSSSFQ